MRRNATKVEHSVNRLRRFSGILYHFSRLRRFPSFFLVAFFSERYRRKIRGEPAYIEVS